MVTFGGREGLWFDGGPWRGFREADKVPDQDGSFKGGLLDNDSLSPQPWGGGSVRSSDSYMRECDGDLDDDPDS